MYVTSIVPSETFIKKKNNDLFLNGVSKIVKNAFEKFCVPLNINAEIE